MRKSCVTNKQLPLFSPGFSESWSPFSQNGLNLEQFVLDIFIPGLLPFFL